MNQTYEPKKSEDKIQSIIHIRDLTKIFWTNNIRQKALSSIDLDISHGEHIAIVGMQGSGKTTLLNIIAGIEKLSAGEVIINGRNLSRMSDEPLSSFRLKNIGFIAPSYGLMEAISVQENVAFPLMVQKIRKSERLERAMIIIKTLGLDKKLRHKPFQLSNLERRYVLIARAIVINPKIVLADELTDNLDGSDAETIIKCLKNISEERSITLLNATHDKKRAILADRIIEIENGRIIF